MSVISILRNCILRILFLSPHRMHMTVCERIVSQGQSNYSRLQIRRGSKSFFGVQMRWKNYNMSLTDMDNKCWQC